VDTVLGYTGVRLFVCRFRRWIHTPGLLFPPPFHLDIVITVSASATLRIPAKHTRNVSVFIQRDYLRGAMFGEGRKTSILFRPSAGRGRWVYTLYHKDPASKRVFTLVLRKAITRLDGVSPYQENVNPQTGSTNWPPMKFRILSGSMAMGSFASARR
jgi:hypothetical protein